MFHFLSFELASLWILTNLYERKRAERILYLFFFLFSIFILFWSNLARGAESQTGIFKFSRIPSLSIELLRHLSIRYHFSINPSSTFCLPWKSKRIKITRGLWWQLESCVGNFHLGTILEGNSRKRFQFDLNWDWYGVLRRRFACKQHTAAK